MTNTNPDQKNRVPIDPDKKDADAASLPLSGLPEADDNLPAVVQDVDTNQTTQLITQIRSADHQVGQHILPPPPDPDTVAVLTTVVIGPKGGQHIVSAGLDPETLEEVQKMLVKAEEDRHEDIPCVGFHCFLKRKPKKEADGDSQA